MSEFKFRELHRPPASEDVCFLYDLLMSRDRAISHQGMPTYEEHADFVEQHPYANWLVVEQFGQRLGAIYIGVDNSVGFHFLPKFDELSEQILLAFESRFEPLPPIKSLRSKKFFFNAAPSDQKKIDLLEKMGYCVSQISFQR
jgi:hypothetical protein